MSKISLTNLVNLQNETTAVNAINANNAALTTALDNTLSRDGTAPNTIGATLDMNSFNIINLPSPATVNSPARLIDVTSNPSMTVPPVGTSGAVVGLLSSNKTDSGNNTFSGTEAFNGAVTFGSTVTLPSNCVGSSQITNNAVANADLAQMATLTIKGNNTGGTANAADLTVAQVNTMLGSTWSNVQSTKVANYTVLTTDIGTTIVTGGGALFTLTFPAAAGFQSNFYVWVFNNDGRGKNIACNGLSTFMLWPQQSILLINQNGVWMVHGRSRYSKTGHVFYVDTALGADTNDGITSGAGAFKTITACVQSLIQNVDAQNSLTNINIAAGTYTESLVLSGQVTGYNAFQMTGAGSGSVTWRPLTNFCLLVSDNAELLISGMTFDNTAGAGGAVAISMHQDSVIDVGTDIKFGAFLGGGAHMNNDKGGYINLPASYGITGGCGTHIQVSSGCIVTQAGGGTVTFTGAPVIGLMYQAIQNSVIAMNGVVAYSGAPAAGTQKYSIDFLSTFVSQGSTLPGTVAGATGHGSQFT